MKFLLVSFHMCGTYKIYITVVTVGLIIRWNNMQKHAIENKLVGEKKYTQTITRN